MTDEFLEEHFKTLLYSLGECNWNVLTDEAWNEFINNDKPFNEAQLNDLRLFVKDLLYDLADKIEVK